MPNSQCKTFREEPIMKNRPSAETCPLCGSSNTEVRFDRVRKFKYLKRILVLNGLEQTVCLDCGCSFNADGQTKRNNERFFEFEKSVLGGIIAPRKIVELRQKYNLTQEEAKKIFKTTGNLFSKWERGESAPSSAVSNLLETALEDPVIMERFARRVGIKLPDNRLHDTKTAIASSAWVDMPFPHLIIEGQISEERIFQKPHRTKFMQIHPYQAAMVNSFSIDPAEDDLQLPEPYVIRQMSAHR